VLTYFRQRRDEIRRVRLSAALFEAEKSGFKPTPAPAA
jgi:hypothetical protein